MGRKTKAAGNKYEKLIRAVVETNKRSRRRKVKRVLLVYELNQFFIGDTCINMSRLKKIKHFYKNAAIDINTVNARHYELVNAILQNNPYVNRFMNESWAAIDLKKYDVVICACLPEDTFVEYLLQEYRRELLSGMINTRFYTAAGCVGFEDRYETLLPLNEQLISYELPRKENSSMMSNELFLAGEEERWSSEWFRTAGLEKGEKLIVMLDSSSNPEKLLRPNVYFGLITRLLDSPGARMMVFDENRTGKKRVYGEKIGKRRARKIIFAEGLSLRQSICLLGNKRFVKMIFGPSTGLLHCASGIYNVKQGKEKTKRGVPLMIGYLGEVAQADYREDLWWNESLADAILLTTSANGRKRIRSIRDVNFNRLKKNKAFHPCRDFSVQLLVEYLAGYKQLRLAA